MLVIVTAAIIAITVWMSGKSYSNLDPIPFDDIRYLVRRLAVRRAAAPSDLAGSM